MAKTIKMNYRDFVIESWKIEGLAIGFNPETNSSGNTSVYSHHHQVFVEQPAVTAEMLGKSASLFTAGEGLLRDRQGMDVRVGQHYPLPGGPAVKAKLEELCRGASKLHPFELHQRFEYLHPFVDGNGRVGRLLWLWSMHQHGLADETEIGFLHRWYYQSLAEWR